MALKSVIDVLALNIYESVCSTYSGSVVFHYAVVKKQAGTGTGTGNATTSIEYRVQEDTQFKSWRVSPENSNVAGIWRMSY